MFKDLKIGTRLIAAFAATLFLMIGLAVFSNSQVNAINANLRTINDVNSVKQRFAINFRGSVHDRAISLRDVVLVSSASERAKAIEDIDTLARKYADSAGPLDAMLAPDKQPDPKELEILASIKETEGKTLPLIQEAIRRKQAGDDAGAWNTLMSEARPLFIEWLARINQFIDHQEAANQALGKTTRDATEAFSLLITLLCIGALVVGSVSAWWSLRSVRPIGHMAAIMERLDEGDGTAPIPGADAGNELGQLARAMAAFRSKLKASQAANLAAERSKQQQVEVIVNSLGEGLTSLAQGDLTVRVTADLEGPFAKLKADFNDALEMLQKVIGQVVQTAGAVRTGSNEIAQASEDLARRTEANAASLEQTSAAITQMDGRLKATSSAANRTVERADAAKSTVQGGREIADEALQAMTRVNDSAKGIDSVIEGLDKIAFQTRVLAMNAAVEAGRAGEAGRGFAVVADLVSALAMRAEEEAGRAREQLTATQADIGAAVERVQKVDDALANITGDVGAVHELLGQMAADNQAQSTAITQIAVAIGVMDQSTQQNAAMVEQTSAAARNLSGEVSALSEQAATFTVGDVAPRTFSPASAGSRKVAGTSYASPVKPLPASISPGSASDDWATF
jgi:methyl-accepting chemotaxis protein